MHLRQARLPVPERLLQGTIPDPTADTGLPAELAQAVGKRATRWGDGWDQGVDNKTMGG